ncbi:hypothetical protein PIB30_002943 [Stylosanthes scabra]|uniref:Transposase (Putative), gypsy type n=1 Tax=Stylosanthes scabra TaxID=79078 RepID=A0ABU6V1H0_9FABA|nr:hypothetical protein [Stylosanthes scabra]
MLVVAGLFINVKNEKNGKKKSCQNVKVPRPLNAVEQRLYGWVEEAVFTQPSVLLADDFPELRRSMRLTEDVTAEGDFVLEAAGPSDRLPIQASGDGPHYLWVYQELFTRLGVRLPFTDFQQEVMTRCRVAVSQLHLNGWAILRTFEWVCLYFGFRPTCRLFMYIYDILIPPTGNCFISFRAHQGRKLFGSFEESIQEFKWHYFKVLSSPGRRAFWLNDEGKPFPWVYWNRGVKDFTVQTLDPLEMAVCYFLLSLPAGLPKKNDFTCRWILDYSDAEVKEYFDSLLLVKMKQSKLDRMMSMLYDPGRMAPRSVLPTGLGTSSSSAAPVFVTPTSVPPEGISTPTPPSASGGSKAKKGGSKRERTPVVNVEKEEGAKEDPSADLKPKRQKKGGKRMDFTDRVLGEDVACEHPVNPLELAFPKEYNFRKALDAGLTTFSVRKPLQTMLSDQLLEESWRLSCQSLACLQALVAKTKAEEELLAAQDQVTLLKAERDSAMAYLPLKEKVDALNDDLSVKEGERQSALERVSRFEEDIKVMQAELKSCRASLEQERGRAEAAEKKVEELSSSLRQSQFDLGAANETATYWCTKWKKLATDAQEMCQETLEIVLDQVSHFCSGVDFSTISLKSRWGPKGRRTYVPEGAPSGDVDMAEASPVVGQG